MGPRHARPGRRWGVGILILGLLLASPVGPVGAQAPGLGLAVTTSQTLYYPGETLSLSLGVDNPGLGATADFYAGVILPDGATVVTFGPDGTPAFGSLGNPAGLRPVATGVSLAAPFSVALAPFLQRLWTGTEPVGLYTLFLAAVRTGALADGRLDAGDLLGLRTVAMRFQPPAQTTLEPGQAATAVISSQGGTLLATSSGGLTYALTVPPGALAQPTPITLTPIAAVTGLPIAGTLAAAVRAEPEGLAFVPPATLTITVPGLGGTSSSLLGFTARGDGTGFQLLPAVGAGDAFTVTLAHFSTAGGLQPDSGTLPGFGTTDPNAPFVEELALLLAPRPDLGSPAFQAAALDILVRWFTQVIRPQLNTAVTDATFIERAVQDYIAFHQAYTVLRVLECADILIVCGLPGGDVDVRPLVTEGFRNALAQANQRCLADKANFLTHIAAVIEVSRVMSALTTDESDEFDLDRVGATLCVRARVRGVLFPGTIPAGQPATLEVQVDVAFTDGVLVPAPENLVVVEVSAVGAILGTGAELISSPGAFVATVTPTPGSLVVTLGIATFWKIFPGESRALSVCVGSPGGPVPARAAPRAAGPIAQEEQCAGLVVTPASVTVAPGGTVQFTASLVAGEPFTDVTWSVTGGGTISPAGLFTAGTTPGTFTVRATSTATPALFEEAQVTVTGGLQVTVTASALDVSFTDPESITGEPRNGEDSYSDTPTGGTLDSVVIEVGDFGAGDPHVVQAGRTVSTQGLFIVQVRAAVFSSLLNPDASAEARARITLRVDAPFAFSVSGRVTCGLGTDAGDSGSLALTGVISMSIACPNSDPNPIILQGTLLPGSYTLEVTTHRQPPDNSGASSSAVITDLQVSMFVE